MNDLIVVKKNAQRQRLKALLLDSVSSPITKWVYSVASNSSSQAGMGQSGSPRQDIYRNQGSGKPR
ncbi:MAG: hypothetical protein ACLPWF_13035 [Bryobacteraceae bacterium]